MACEGETAGPAEEPTPCPAAGPCEANQTPEDCGHCSPPGVGRSEGIWFPCETVSADDRCHVTDSDDRAVCRTCGDCLLRHVRAADDGNARPTWTCPGLPHAGCVGSQVDCNEE